MNLLCPFTAATPKPDRGTARRGEPLKEVPVMRWPLLLAPLAGLSGEAGVGRTGDAGVGSSAAKSEGMEASDDESEARPRPGEAPGLHNSHLAAEAGFWKVHASQDHTARRRLKMASVFAPLLLAASQFVPYAKSHIIFLYQVIFLLIVIVTGFQTFSESLKPSLPLFFQLCSFAASGFFSPIKNKFSSPDFKAGLCLALFSWTLVSSSPDCFLLSHQEVFLPLHPYHVTRAVFELTTLTAAETSLDVKAYFGSPFCTEFVYSYSETSWLPYFTSATSHRNVWRQLWITFRVICKVVHTAPSGRRDSIHPYCCGSILLPPLFRVGHMDTHNFTAGLCWVSCCSPSCAMQPIHLGFRRGICRWAIGNLTLDSVSVFYMVHLSYSLMLASWSKLSSRFYCWISGLSWDTWTSRAFTWKLSRTCFMHLSFRKLCSCVVGSINLHYSNLDHSFIRLLLAKLGSAGSYGVVNFVPIIGQKFMVTVRLDATLLLRKAIQLFPELSVYSMLTGRNLRKTKHCCSRVSCSLDTIYAKLSSGLQIKLCTSNLF